jgi:sulfite exporter TauE/SafE
MPELALVFLAGLAGSFHCVGMCGGFACALGSRGGWGRHLAYNAGRLASYVFLGALAGAVGQTVCGAGEQLSWSDAAGTLQRMLAVVSGALMVVMALGLLGLLGLRRTGAFFDLGPVAALLRPLLTARGIAAPLAFGVFNGFLPCPLVYAFAAQAAAGFDPLTGALVMASFGAGTFPAMLLIGSLGRWAGPAALRRGVTMAGCLVLAMGAVTLARGLLPVLHGHAAP